jgi:hypothetical protein
MTFRVAQVELTFQGFCRGGLQQEAWGGGGVGVVKAVVQTRLAGVLSGGREKGSA